MTDEPNEHQPMTDEEGERALREEIKRLRVTDLAFEMMISLVTVGYQKLGLTEQTRELRDLDDAHMAIELLRATLDVAEREGGAAAFKDLRSTLAQMQLGYVQGLQLAEREERAAAGGSAAAQAGEAPAGAEAADEAPADAAQEPARRGDEPDAASD